MRFSTVFAMGITGAVACGVGLAQSVAPAQVAENPTAIWNFQAENASVGLGRITDRYYTNGLRIGWTSPIGAVPASLAQAARALLGEGSQRVSVDVSQMIYTPLATKVAVPPVGDRPYAGVLMAQVALVQDTATSRTQLGAGVGVLGPAALGQQVQNGFHSLIGQASNLGWGRQLANEPVVQIAARRGWRVGLGDNVGLQNDILPALAAEAGNLRVSAQAGFTLRIGQGLESDFGPVRIRSGLSGGDAFAADDFAWYVFAGLHGHAVARDAALDGNLFVAGPSVQRTPLVGEATAGFALMAYGMRLTYSHVLQTQQFRRQKGGLHQVGSLALGVRF